MAVVKDSIVKFWRVAGLLVVFLSICLLNRLFVCLSMYLSVCASVLVCSSCLTDRACLHVCVFVCSDTPCLTNSDISLLTNSDTPLLIQSRKT